MRYDLSDMNLKTGIDRSFLEKDIAILNALPKIFMVLRNNGISAALYGGTALNKIYYRERQRLSYDINLLCYDYEKTQDYFKRNFKSEFLGKNRSFFDFEGVRVDISPIKFNFEKPQEVEAKSLLSFFGYPLTSVVVPSYSLEYLLSLKILALVSRAQLKDIYDSWMGLNLIGDYKRLKSYLTKIERTEETDFMVLFDEILRSKEYYAKGTESIEITQKTDTELMLKDIKTKLELLF